MYAIDKYGLSFYVGNKKDEIDFKDCYVDLMPYLPKYWHSIKEMIAIQHTLGKEVGILNCHLKDLFKQCFIETATWGLDLWEEELGLQTNLKRSYEHRREIIKAKLQGTSTTTKQLLERITSMFSNRETKVIEHNDKYAFEIKFIGVKGIPANMQSLKDIIEQIKPAHLGILYTYTFTVWKDVKKHNWGEFCANVWKNVRKLTCNKLKEKTWQQAKQLDQEKSWYDVKVLEEE